MDTEYDQRIAKLLDGLRLDLRRNMQPPSRPFTVEFDGMPSSGKTTIIRALDKYFRHNGWRVFPPPEGAQVIRHIPRASLAQYNIRTALYSIQKIMDVSYTHMYDILLLDRGIFDASCWVEYLHQRGLLTDSEKNALNLFYLLPCFTQKIDCALVVVCNPDAAFERVKAMQISDDMGFTNPRSLKSLYEQSCELYGQYRHAYPQLQLLDTTSLKPREMVQRAADIVLSTLSCSIKNDMAPTPPAYTL